MAKSSAKKVTPVSVDDVLGMLASMSEEERANVMRKAKDTGITLKVGKKEKTYVAKRIQTKDTLPTARRVRKAGEEFMLTEKALDFTLATYIRGKDAETRIPLVKKSILAGHKESFSSFEIVGIAQ